MVRVARDFSRADLAGLIVAWGGTALLVSPAARVLGAPTSLRTALIAQALFWSIGLGVFAILHYGERDTLDSAWLRPFRWSSIAWGLALVAAYYAVLFPAGEWVRRTAGLSGFAQGMTSVMVFPLWYRTIAVLGAAIVEEFLFRGYTVTRLARLTGSTWSAAAIALVGFSALHGPMWGLGFVVEGLVSGTAMMAFFVWKKDLMAMMVAHGTIDAIAIVVMPMLSAWWRVPGYL